MTDEILEIVQESSDAHPQPAQMDGVVIGVLAGFDENGIPLVVFPGNQSDSGIGALSSTNLTKDDVGTQVALLFEQGDPKRPLIIGRIRHPIEISQSDAKSLVSAEVDKERIVFDAEKEIVLRCGKASLTLTKAGKILLRGAYVLSRSSGVNRIKGGSVQIN